MNQCSVCGHQIVTGVWGHMHEDICEYLRFKSQEAPMLKLCSLTYNDVGISFGHPGYMRHNSEMDKLSEVNETLISLGYSAKTFKMSGIGGSFFEVFVSEDIIDAVRVYYALKEGYAGMTFAEFLVSMVPRDT